MVKSQSTQASNRIRTIDIVRALTMFFMIFVNDLWSLTGVPQWLQHTLAEEDGMGFSDIIFPLFLFIVGLSIPLAIDVRVKKQQSRLEILRHIFERTLALLLMGFYMVNAEVINEVAMGLDRHIWQIMMASAIFLIWMDYKRLPALKGTLMRGLKVTGLLLLIYLAWVYRGGTEENIIWMKPHWWGILGLIGWAYLLNSLLYFVAGKKWEYLLPTFVFLLFMNIQENNFFEFLPSFQLVVSASNHVLVMSGMLCTILYLRRRSNSDEVNPFLLRVFVLGMIFLSYGFLLRPSFPISKILATPSWTAICIGISLLTYALLYIIVDKWNHYQWANPIWPAGTSTLTCYLMPYFIYPLLALVNFQWPDFLTAGTVGLVKSLLFSLIIVMFVGMLERRNIRLRI